MVWLLLRVSVRMSGKKNDYGHVCAKKSRGKDYLKQFFNYYILDMQGIISLSALVPALLQK